MCKVGILQQGFQWYLQNIKIFKNLKVIFLNSIVDSYCKVTQKIKPFEFNPSKTSEKNIVNLLYENILTVSSSSTDVDE